MANKRHLKKSINCIADMLIDNCIILHQNLSEEYSQDVLKHAEHILETRNEHLRRVSHPEPGNIKGSYRKIKESYSKEVGNIINDLSTLFEKLS